MYNGRKGPSLLSSAQSPVLNEMSLCLAAVDTQVSLVSPVNCEYKNALLSHLCLLVIHRHPMQSELIMEKLI